MILNLGCGTEKIKDCINIDVLLGNNPDIVCNFLNPLPFRKESIDKIYLFHVIEHIPKIHHVNLIKNISQILKLNGVLFISYPEFTRCANNFIENKQGKREFWEATIYGRQTHPYDFHNALMYTPHFTSFMGALGYEVESKPEENQDFNTICKCVKVREPLTIESVYKDKWFNNANYKRTIPTKNTTDTK